MKAKSEMQMFMKSFKNKNCFCMLVDINWVVKPEPRKHMVSFGNRSVNRTKMRVF